MSGFSADHPGAEIRVSPNFGLRAQGRGPDMIVLHYTGMESADAAEAWLCDPASEVSSHYLVHEDGRIVQMVRESDRAWHAGRASWKGEKDVNSLSIGIEIANRGHFLGYDAFPEDQIEAVIALCRGIMSRHAVTPERVLAHSDVAPGRKIDPGEKFPWRRLHEAGIGHFVEGPQPGGSRRMALGARGRRVEELQSMLGLYGYGVEITGTFDPLTRTVVEAFQRHFRPALVDGCADVSTLETLHRLLRHERGNPA
jgi:N-acetylmuramoyl-L-alanine amidase